jgi:amidophosphoribosyltransferase
MISFSAYERSRSSFTTAPEEESNMFPDLARDDSPHDECGVFGVYAPGVDVARLTYFGLYALQHRGQESAGIAVSNNGEIFLRKRLGLVSQVFEESDLKHLSGQIAVGHTRYSTTGSTLPENAGPMAADSPLGTLVVAHNGNISNAADLHTELAAEGVRFQTTTDSEILTRLIARAPGDTMLEKLQASLQRCRGAYSLCILTPHTLYALRDPHGIRPLCLGRTEEGWVVASESCALATVGATFVRDVEPGELLIIDEDGVRSERMTASRQSAMCLFEFIYFARPDSQILGERLHLARQRMGAELAREAPVDADVVVPLPDSAVPAAIGYARESGIPYSEGLIKNRYIGRTFIQPDQRMRDMGVRLKFNVLPEVVRGKRVILIDDSIVRGTTSRPIVNLVRDAGAKEVHMRVHSPPIMWPCHLGVDMATRDELIAANMSVEEIAEHIGADSLAYLSLEALVRSTNNGTTGFCTGCLSGEYPVPPEDISGKNALEGSKSVIPLVPVRSS